MTADNIWDLAIQLSRKESEDLRENKDVTLLFVGSKQGGKSSIIYRFIERHENPKPSIALEYLFGRRSKGLDTTKEVCHIWELAGGTLFTQLLEISITPENLRNLSLVLVLDLSMPEELWFTMETLLYEIKERIKKVLKSVKDKSLTSWLEQEAQRRIGENPQDREMLDPFPVPLLILGSKYDIFQDFDPEKKKVICKCLRFVSHINGASLYFISTKIENLVNKGRVAISHLAFKTAASKAILDYNKPIVVPFGGDSLQLIGNMPLTDDDPGRSHPKSLDMWKHTFLSHYPQVVTKVSLPEDPAQDPSFKERDIDIIVAQKNKELEEYRKELQSRRRNAYDFDFD